MDTLLALEHVSKSHWRGDSEVRVLTDVTLELGVGEFVAVWGRRGAGKSTLLKLAARLELPDRGSVRFGGAELSGLSQAAHARLMLERIGWVRRMGPAIDLRVLEYVALPLLARHGHRSAYARARAALTLVGAADCAQQRWGSLCDGERALIGIAHGIVRQPDLVLVDDPTANLDVLEREQITCLLRSLADEEGVSVLMAVSDMPAAMGAHRVAALGGGRLSPTQSRYELMEGPGNVVPLRGGERSA